MKDQNFGSSRKTSWLSRRTLLRSTAGTVLGAGLVHPNWVFAGDDNSKPMECVGPNPIPGGITAHSHPMGFSSITIHSILPIR